jgi:N-acetyl-anhydromuramyl-L-alanine amidase AmpD
MSTDGFPGAIWIPAHTDRYARRESRTIEEIVLHITEGGTDKADITAHNAFGGPKYLQGGKWMQQAAHYIVGRDGAVVQCVRHKDVAYHAGPANEWTIGIEHNTRSGSKLKDTKLTAAQYLKSAELVLWLCNMLGFSADRNHISGHSEADPSATHSSCPQRVLKWDTYMAAISDQRLIAQGGTPMRLWNDDEI